MRLPKLQVIFVYNSYETDCGLSELETILKL